MHSYAMSAHEDLVDSETWRDALRSHSLRNVEYSLSAAPHPAISARHAATLRTLVREGLLGVKSLHLPFSPFSLWQYTSKNEVARKGTIRLTLEYMEHFSGLDIRDITIHAGGEPNAPEERKDRMEQMIRSCRDLQPMLERWEASLNIELLPRSCIGNHEDELLYMIAELPAKYFNICLDVNHLMARHAEIPAVIRKCGARIRSLHISDYDGVDECHWPVGQGVIAWTEVSTAIKSLEQDVLVIIETLSPRVPGDKRRLVPSLVIDSAEQDCLRLEYAMEWDVLRRRFWPPTAQTHGGAE